MHLLLPEFFSGNKHTVQLVLVQVRKVVTFLELKLIFSSDCLDEGFSVTNVA